MSGCKGSGFQIKGLGWRVKEIKNAARWPPLWLVPDFGGHWNVIRQDLALNTLSGFSIGKIGKVLQG